MNYYLLLVSFAYSLVAWYLWDWHWKVQGRQVEVFRIDGPPNQSQMIDGVATQTGDLVVIKNQRVGELVSHRTIFFLCALWPFAGLAVLYYYIREHLPTYPGQGQKEVLWNSDWNGLCIDGNLYHYARCMYREWPLPIWPGPRHLGWEIVGPMVEDPDDKPRRIVVRELPPPFDKYVPLS